LAADAESMRLGWCVEGVLSTTIEVVYAISDLHGDAGLFVFWLESAGLVRRVMRDGQSDYEWADPRAALVVCGDAVDDHRGGYDGPDRDTELLNRNFEGFKDALPGSGSWNVLAFINYLVARRGARIVVVLGNHELMSIRDESQEYKRDVTKRVETMRGGWGPGGGMRELLGETPLVAVCAGSLLLMHAEPPIFGADVAAREEFGFGGSSGRRGHRGHRGNQALAEKFTRTINDQARDLADPLVGLALWGRSLGSDLAKRPDACGTYRLMLPGVTLVRGHCPNRVERATLGGDGPQERGLAFGARNLVDGAGARLEGASGCRPRDCAVYTASGPRELVQRGSGYGGVVVSCSARGDSGFGGSVFRIDCMGSLAFDLRERPCSVVAFEVATGRAYCLVGERPVR
jgi:hypothetical protein